MNRMFTLVCMSALVMASGCSEKPDNKTPPVAEEVKGVQMKHIDGGANYRFEVQCHDGVKYLITGVGGTIIMRKPDETVATC